MSRRCSPADDFKRGAADVFTVEGPKLGDVVRAVVAHDGKGLLGGADWHLQMINVADSSTTKETSFWCDAWIAKNAPKTMELSSAAGASASHGRHRYKITVGGGHRPATVTRAGHVRYQV